MTQNPDVPLDMDTLLAGAEAAPQPEEETPEQRRIRELQEELAKPLPPPPPPLPETPEPFVPTEKLTPDQQRIRELEDQLARRNAEILDASPLTYEQPREDGEKILIHFLEDGCSFGGQVWYRGQEVEFTVGSDNYQKQFDTKGRSWLDLADDKAAQFKRWGRQMFASGPWPGKPWGDTSGLTDPDEIKAAEAAAEAERRRGRGAPVGL